MLFVYVGLSITIEDICYHEELSTNKSLVKVNVLYIKELLEGWVAAQAREQIA